MNLPDHITRQQITDAFAILGPVWNRWAPDALESPLAPAHLVEAYNRWQPDHLKIRRAVARG